MTVVAYYRFSNVEQAEGTSIKRQQQDCRDFAVRQGWVVDQEISDRGVSAFSGANVAQGAALGSWLSDARLGLHHGKTLLVERVDRLSRQGFDETSDMIRSLVASGVTVAIVDGGEIYQAGQRLDTFQIIKLLLKAELAHEESVKKSQRLKRRYEIKREEARATGKALSRMMPPWLTIGLDGCPALVEDRAKVVQRIFELADAGHGSLVITQYINREFAPWQNQAGKNAAQWGRTRITRILADRQVTGEYQPMSRTDGERVPAGGPWPDYYPRVIDQDLFERVSAMATTRQSPAGRKSRTVANLFSSLLRCRCGSPMMFELRRKAGAKYHGGTQRLKHDEARIRCSKARFGGSCDNHDTISYHGLESAMLDACLHLALDDQSFAKSDDLGKITVALAEKRRAHELAEAGAVKLWEAYRETGSRMAMSQASEAEREAEALAVEVAELEKAAASAAGKVDAEAHLTRVADMRHLLYAEDLEIRTQHRTKVAQGFRAIVERMTCSGKQVQVRMVGGARLIKIERGQIVSNFSLRKDSDDLSEIPDLLTRKFRERDRLQRTGAVQPIPRKRTYNGRERT